MTFRATRWRCEVHQRLRVFNSLMQAAFLLYRRVIFVLLSMVLTGTLNSAAAQERPRQPSSTPTPQSEEQEPVKVFTEEVRRPRVAVDQYGPYHPPLAVDTR